MIGQNYAYILFLLVLTVNTVFSQEEKSTHLGFTINPKLTINISNTETPIINDTHFNYSAGLDFYFDLSANHQFKTGLYYTAISFSQIDYSPRFPTDHDENGSFDPYRSYITDDIQFHHVSIPLDVRHKLKGAANHIYFRAGIEPSLLVSENSESFFFQPGIGSPTIKRQISNLRKRSNINLNVKLGIGYEFALKSKMKLFIEPLIEIGITRIFKQPITFNNSRNLNLGIAVGTNF